MFEKENKGIEQVIDDGDNDVVLTGNLHFKDAVQKSVCADGKSFVSFQLQVKKTGKDGRISKHFLLTKCFLDDVSSKIIEMPRGAKLKIHGHLESFNGRVYVNANDIQQLS